MPILKILLTHTVTVKQLPQVSRDLINIFSNLRACYTARKSTT